MYYNISVTEHDTFCVSLPAENVPNEVVCQLSELSIWGTPIAEEDKGLIWEVERTELPEVNELLFENGYTRTL